MGRSRFIQHLCFLINTCHSSSAKHPQAQQKHLLLQFSNTFKLLPWPFSHSRTKPLLLWLLPPSTTLLPKTPTTSSQRLLIPSRALKTSRATVAPEPSRRSLSLKVYIYIYHVPSFSLYFMYMHR